MTWSLNMKTDSIASPVNSIRSAAINSSTQRSVVQIAAVVSLHFIVFLSFCASASAGSELSSEQLFQKRVVETAKDCQKVQALGGRYHVRTPSCDEASSYETMSSKRDLRRALADACDSMAGLEVAGSPSYTQLIEERDLNRNSQHELENSILSAITQEIDLKLNELRTAQVASPEVYNGLEKAGRSTASRSADGLDAVSLQQAQGLE
jgi:hypothetical protein